MAVGDGWCEKRPALQTSRFSAGLRRARAGIAPLDLLFVPVGTQPYAPILAIIANPSRCVALLETERSAPHGAQVDEACREALPAAYLHVLAAETDIADIGNKMKAVYDTRGLPSGANVGVDITGGRKPMTAAIAGVGSLYDWRLFYVDAVHERERAGLGHHERIVELKNVLDVYSFLTERGKLGLGHHWVASTSDSNCRTSRLLRAHEQGSSLAMKSPFVACTQYCHWQ